MICLFGLSAGVQRNTNVYIEPSKRDWIAPRRAIFSSAHQPSSQGTFNQGGFNTSQWKKDSIPGRTIFRTILSHFVFPSTGQLSESISSSFKGQRESFYHPATNEINFKEIIPSL
jgi:hypothetical protein